MPHTLEPPPRGSVCRIVTFPPDAVFRGKVGAREVEAYFRAMGSPQASTYAPQAPHPYMQKTRTLDFCLVLEGEITLVLDTEEVQPEGRRHRDPARHQSRLEQSLRRALRDRDLLARRGVLNFKPPGGPCFELRAFARSSA